MLDVGGGGGYSMSLQSAISKRTFLLKGVFAIIEEKYEKHLKQMQEKQLYIGWATQPQTKVLSGTSARIIHKTNEMRYFSLLVKPVFLCKL